MNASNPEMKPEQQREAALFQAAAQLTAAERTAFSAFATPTQSDPRALMLGFEVARALETATDHLAHAALSLRDLVLEDLSA